MMPIILFVTTKCAVVHASGLGIRLSAMQCSDCGENIQGEWINWRRYDKAEVCGVRIHLDPDVRSPKHRDKFKLYVWKGLAWFFFCQACRRRNYMLRGWYVNKTGKESKDSDSDDCPLYKQYKYKHSDVSVNRLADKHSDVSVNRNPWWWRRW